MYMYYKMQYILLLYDCIQTINLNVLGRKKLLLQIIHVILRISFEIWVAAVFPKIFLRSDSSPRVDFIKFILFKHLKYKIMH